MTKKKPAMVPNEKLLGLDMLNLLLPVRNIPDSTYERTYRATEDELKNLSKLLGLGELSHVKISYSVAAVGNRSFRMKSDIKAEINQICVFTLVPIVNLINDQAATKFVRRKTFEEIIEQDEDEIVSDDNLEPYDDAQLEIGRVLYEQLVGSIDCFPRAPDAMLDQLAYRGNGTDEADAGPFAALAGRKKV